MTTPREYMTERDVMGLFSCANPATFRARLLPRLIECGFPDREPWSSPHAKLWDPAKVQAWQNASLSPEELAAANPASDDSPIPEAVDWDRELAERAYQ